MRKNFLNDQFANINFQIIYFVQQKVYKSGSSLVVVVPSSFVEAIGIDKGDTVKVKIDYSLGKIEYSFSGNRQLTFDSNFTKTKKK